MKHSWKITLLLIAMFSITQLFGLFVISSHAPQTTQITTPEGNVTNVTSYNLPYGLDPPPETKPRAAKEIVISFAIIFTIAIFLMILLMKFQKNFLIRLWFFVVVALAVAVAISSVFSKFNLFNYSINLIIPGKTNLSSVISLLIALPLSYYKVYRRNFYVHNFTELMIYPGIAAIFVALVLSWTNSPIFAVSLILVIISIYDMYAVWHSGFMQKMAHYQIRNLRIFTGFFIPYIGKKERELMKKVKASKQIMKDKKIKVNVALLGGGDIVFPLILAGVVLIKIGLVQAFLISLGATLALSFLFYTSEKGKFYPAMPFITIGAFIGLALAYLL